MVTIHGIAAVTAPLTRLQLDGLERLLGDIHDEVYPGTQAPVYHLQRAPCDELSLSFPSAALAALLTM